MSTPREMPTPAQFEEALRVVTARRKAAVARLMRVERQAHLILDYVDRDEETPLFTDAEMAELRIVPVSRVESLLEAIHEKLDRPAPPAPRRARVLKARYVREAAAPKPAEPKPAERPAPVQPTRAASPPPAPPSQVPSPPQQRAPAPPAPTVRAVPPSMPLTPRQEAEHAVRESNRARPLSDEEHMEAALGMVLTILSSAHGPLAPRTILEDAVDLSIHLNNISTKSPIHNMGHILQTGVARGMWVETGNGFQIRRDATEA